MLLGIELYLRYLASTVVDLHRAPYVQSVNTLGTAKTLIKSLPARKGVDDRRIFVVGV